MNKWPRIRRPKWPIYRRHRQWHGSTTVFGHFALVMRPEGYPYPSFPILEPKAPAFSDVKRPLIGFGWRLASGPNTTMPRAAWLTTIALAVTLLSVTVSPSQLDALAGPPGPHDQSLAIQSAAPQSLTPGDPARPVVGQGGPLVTQTLVLFNNTLAPDNYLAADNTGPWGMAYDPIHGEIFVANFDSSTVAVISDRTDQILTTVPVGIAPEFPVYDPVTQEVYVPNFDSSDVSVISTANNSVVATIPVGMSPQYAAFDPVRGEVFVVDQGGTGVSVIAGSNRTVVANIPLPGLGSGIACDNRTGTVYISFGSNGLYAISDANNSVVSTISLGLPAGAGPGQVAFDAGTDQIFVVATGMAGYLIVVNASSEAVATTITLGSLQRSVEPTGLAYDPSTSEVFVSLANPGSVRVVADRNDTVMGTIQAGFLPWELVYDSGQSEVFVANRGSNNLSVISDTTDRVTASILEGTTPIAVAYDGGRNEIAVLDQAPSELLLVSAATGHIVAKVPLGYGADGLAYDSSRGEFLVAGINVTRAAIISDLTNGIVGYLPVGGPPHALAYDPVRGEVYIANGGSNNVTVISDATGSAVANVPVGADPDALAYDPASAEMFVSNRGSSTVSVISDLNHSVVATLPLPKPGISGYLPNDGIACDSATNQVFVTSPSSGTVTILSAANHSVLQTISLGIEPSGVAVAGGKGEVFVTDSYSGNVSVLFDGTDQIAASVPVGAYPQSIAYDPSAGLAYSVNTEQGTLSFIASSALYPVRFNETGLDTWTRWAVSVDGVEASSIGSSIDFAETNGTHSYIPGTEPNYRLPEPSGSFVVSGSRVEIAVLYIWSPPPVYNVTFLETGLPAGTSWTVTLNGTSLTSTSNAIRFDERAGTYNFTVDGVSTYVPTVYTGSVSVGYSDVDYSLGFRSTSPAGITGASSTVATYVIVGLAIAIAVSITILAMRSRRPPQPSGSMLPKFE